MTRFFCLLSLTLALVWVSACRGRQEPPPHGPGASHDAAHDAKASIHDASHAKAAERKILYYKDPMHPWYTSEQAGKAPDCGMDLVPVYEDEAGLGLRLSEEKKRLIGIKTEAVEHRRLVREIEAAGRVAYDPDLFNAQSDYLIALQTPGGELQALQNRLAEAARQRLKIMGMNEEQIAALRHRNKPEQSELLLPRTDEEAWIYASAYEADLPWLQEGIEAEVFVPGSPEPYPSTLASIDPVIEPMTRTLRLRFKLKNREGKLKPEMYVRVKIDSDQGCALVVPASAVIDTGKRQVAYVEAEKGHFEAREVKTGRRSSEYIEVLSGLEMGDQVVVAGAFMLDSESRLKLAPTAGHQH